MTKLLARYRAYRAEMRWMRDQLAELSGPSYLDTIDARR